MFDFNSNLRKIEINIEEGFRAYFTYDSILSKVADSEKFRAKINHHKYFWHTIIYSLQSTYFLCLGKVFDNGAAVPSINGFINDCTREIVLFSRDELRKRKIDSIVNDNELEAYLDGAFFPGVEDFKPIKNILKTYEKKYRNTYSAIRNKVFGHLEITRKEALETLFRDTSRQEVEQIFMMLKHIVVELWSLYNNGKKITLSNSIYINNFKLYEQIKTESNDVLNKLIAL